MFHMLKQHLGEQTTSNMFQHLGLLKTTCGTTFTVGLRVPVRVVTLNLNGMPPMALGL